jgi:tRNA-splicing ligase RtcB
VISELRGSAHPIYLWTRPDEVESVALDQLRNIGNLPWIHHHVAVMPDVHYGKGATVGSVIAMNGAVSPSAVGVDIGCGMLAAKTTLTAADLPGSLAAVRSSVEAAIPVGFNRHTTVSRKVDALALWHEFDQLDPKVQDLAGRAQAQMGSLGGGNHFIELCLDEHDAVWMMLHSGSRNIGKVLAEIHINTAKALPHNQDLPDRDLAVFLTGTSEMSAYRRDLFWAQRYALANRETMFGLYLDTLRKHFPAVDTMLKVSCHHNYVAEEYHYGADVLVTRKGAISAMAGEYGIIPGSMGTRSYIVRGLGNPESFTSASHGAGRRMSRGAAKRAYSVGDLEAQTAGVECRKDAGVLDEIPAAYKRIEDVMANQVDLVEVYAELRQVMCVKG